MIPSFMKLLSNTTINTAMQTIATHPTVQKVFSYFLRYGHFHYIENISHQEHAIQTAELAEIAGSDPEVILAALLHDIGHLLENEEDELMGRFGGMDHQELGASFLHQLHFSEKVTALVGGHVDAKRYLSFRQDGYINQLSETSRLTLTYQGGPMTTEEADVFENTEWFKDKIQLRLWDDQAQVPGFGRSSLQKYMTMMQDYIDSIGSR